MYILIHKWSQRYLVGLRSDLYNDDQQSEWRIAHDENSNGIETTAKFEYFEYILYSVKTGRSLYRSTSKSPHQAIEIVHAKALRSLKNCGYIRVDQCQEIVLK